MRNLTLIVLVTAVLCGVLSTRALTAAYNQPSESPGKPKVYLNVSPAEIERSPANFEGSYVQTADYFDRPVRRFPRALRRYNVTADTHFGFLTHRVLGSNMICVVPRDSEEAQTILPTLISESPIYLMGRVGPRVELREGIATLFFVERIARGHTPPPLLKKKEKKAIVFTLEWETETPQGVKVSKRRYKIPEPGKRYIIKDPYTGENLYMTFEF